MFIGACLPSMTLPTLSIRYKLTGCMNISVISIATAESQGSFLHFIKTLYFMLFSLLQFNNVLLVEDHFLSSCNRV